MKQIALSLLILTVLMISESCSSSKSIQKYEATIDSLSNVLKNNRAQADSADQRAMVQAEIARKEARRAMTQAELVHKAHKQNELGMKDVLEMKAQNDSLKAVIDSLAQIIGKK